MTFCSKPTIPLNIEDKQIILNKIKKMVNFKKPKVFNFSRYNVNDLNRNPYLLTFQTNGTPFYLYLTTLNGMKFSLFVNYQNPYNIELINVKLRFNEELYNDTIIDGELMMNDKGNWIYMLNNILYNKSNYIGNKYLGFRISVLSDILRNAYKFDDFLNPCHLQLRSYFLFNHLELLSTTQNNNLLLVPEYSNKPILAFNIKNLDKNERMIKNLALNKNNLETKKFYVIATDVPDVFKLYNTEQDNPETFQGIGCISTRGQSFYMKKLFDEKDQNQKGLWINFNYNKHLKGWEPII